MNSRSIIYNIMIEITLISEKVYILKVNQMSRNIALPTNLSIVVLKSQT